MTESPDTRPTRRIVFHGLGALGVAAVLAGCGGGSSQAGSDGSGQGSEGGGSGAGSSASAGPAGTTLVATSDVPVNGGVILTEQKIVVTQPTEGEFKAFSAVCTHQGFLVTSVSDGTIMCDHHGSQYSASTGQVTAPPAPAPLASVAVKVAGGNVVTA